MKKKIKILKADYNKKDNVVIWDVLFEDNKRMKLVNNAEEVIRNAINNPKLKVTEEMILVFNKNIEGTFKIMDFVSVSNSIKDIDKEKVEDFKSCLDEFPLAEAANLAEKELKESNE